MRQIRLAESRASRWGGGIARSNVWTTAIQREASTRTDASRGCARLWSRPGGDCPGPGRDARPFRLFLGSSCRQKPLAQFHQRMVSDRSFLRLIAMEGGLLALFFLYLRWRGWRPGDFKNPARLEGHAPGPPAADRGRKRQCRHRPRPPNLGGLGGAASARVAGGFRGALPHVPVTALKSRGCPSSSGPSSTPFWRSLFLWAMPFINLPPGAAPSSPFFRWSCCACCSTPTRGLSKCWASPAFSFVYGLAYWYLRRLWPLILGHACMDIVAFSALKIFFGR